MVTKGGAGVFLTEEAAALQLWDDMVDEIGQRGRQSRRDEVEAVGRAGGEPLLDGVGDLFGRAGKQTMSRPLLSRSNSSRTVRLSVSTKRFTRVSRLLMNVSPGPRRGSSVSGRDRPW